jgi:cysteinyl-tRNA synthetase
MTLSLYDSKSQALRAFQPIKEGQVGIYVCGPTVQGAPHVGHLRSALVYDILRRWLEATGHKVTLVRNVTDIDDKVLENAKAEGENWWALAYRFEQEFNAAYRKIGIQAPTYEPRATGAIPEMLEIIDRLIARGYAYATEDGSVYFESARWPNYGELTNQKLDDMEAGEASETGKRNPHDFALWKAAKAGEPESAGWDSKFGRGRPGWHIECSAMSTKYLGTNFDIHGGGLDLRFPHHENELAQSTAAGDAFANYWIHNALVNVNGQKMSKSLGNSIFAEDLFAKGSDIAVRYYLSSAHYRSVLDYHEGVLDEATTAVARIETFLKRALRVLATDAKLLSLVPGVPAKFADAMNDDLNLPIAIGVIHETVREGNAALDANDIDAARSSFLAVLGMTNVLLINPLASIWGKSGEDQLTHQALDSLIRSIIEQRNAARAAKDFATADKWRDIITAAGIKLEDAADQTHWSVD